VDHLRSLKENIIMGRLIPAGTGYKYYRDVELKDDREVETEKATDDALLPS
jgi:DNA-directed RNA polymerase subunit beta'